jgi:transposase-like protein
VPFFAFAPGIRKMIYTTNAVEALHRSLRKIIKTRGSFPNDEAALKLLYPDFLNWRTESAISKKKCESNQGVKAEKRV